MKLATVRTGGSTKAARVEGDAIVELGFTDVGALLGSGPSWRDHASAAGRERPLAEADLAPVVVAPAKIVCVGWNYADHVAEMGGDLPPHPTLFAKFASTLAGPYDPVILPAISSEVDWEVELAVVIGAPASQLSPERAGSVIAGYAVANDVSMRDLQYRTSQFFQGKNFDASTPLGPWMVTPDELPGGSPDGLGVSLSIDGEVMQEGNTSQMIFRPDWLVSYLSGFMSLSPGDIILTGTPQGVGRGRTPPVYLAPGQVVRATVEGIGSIENRFVEDPTTPAV